MASLVAKSAAEGLLPVTIGSVTLSEAPLGAITGIAPFRERAADVSAALEAAHGIGLPAPSRFTGGEGALIVSTGPGQALLIGADAAPAGAAVTDQSDAWAHLILEGAAARDVLARLTPVDLRDRRFEVGHAAQTLIFHMTASLLRTGPARWEILVFRSMARTAVHDLTEAMRGVAGRD